MFSVNYHFQDLFMILAGDKPKNHKKNMIMVTKLRVYHHRKSVRCQTGQNVITQYICT